MSTFATPHPNTDLKRSSSGRYLLLLPLVFGLTCAAFYYYKAQPNDDEIGRVRMDKSSGRNEPHANQKARDKAQQEYEKIRKEFQNWNRKPNKTPDDKKFIEKLRKQLERLRKKKDFNGENHSQKHKGN
jgi:hypothetical protein